MCAGRLLQAARFCGAGNDMVLRPRHGLSLCAGGGGLEMGLALAEPGFTTACYVETEPYAQASLIAGMLGGFLPGASEHGPGLEGPSGKRIHARGASFVRPAPVWGNLRTFVGYEWRGVVDTVLAGYPCQPFSAAGQRKGADDERHLWPDVARVIRECRPRWVFLENVAGHVSLGAETVLRELWDMGWTPAAGIFSASETGVPHERQRWFCVAYRDDGVRPLQSEGGQPDQRRRAGDSGDELADASGAERQGQQRSQHDTRGRKEPDGHSALLCRTGLHPPGPSDAAAWRAVLDVAPDLAPAVSLRDVKRAADDLAPLVAEGRMAEGEAQSILRGMADGMAARTRALRLLGNGVHPLAAGYAWRTLSDAHGLRPVDLEAASGSQDAATDDHVLRAAE